MRMRVVSPTLVPAQQVRLVLSIRSTSQAPAHLDLPVLVTVPVLDVPVAASRRTSAAAGTGP